MANPTQILIYVEIGQKRFFAGALDWPGWCRSGKDEAAAVQTLLDYAPRYASILHSAHLGYKPPDSLAQFKLVERLKGGTTTDFGAPESAPSVDAHSMDEAELKRSQKLLQTCWQAFDKAVEQARGKRLRTGPRGGGRDLEGIIRHVIESQGGYLASIGWKQKKLPAHDTQKRSDQTRKDILDGLTAAALGELPPVGPRGGIRWKPRYFVRRVTWHVLDHTWELEDRSA